MIVASYRHRFLYSRCTRVRSRSEELQVMEVRPQTGKGRSDESLKTGPLDRKALDQLLQFDFLEFQSLFLR